METLTLMLGSDIFDIWSKHRALLIFLSFMMVSPYQMKQSTAAYIGAGRLATTQVWLKKNSWRGHLNTSPTILSSYWSNDSEHVVGDVAPGRKPQKFLTWQTFAQGVGEHSTPFLMLIVRPEWMLAVCQPRPNHFFLTELNLCWFAL